MKGKDNRTNKYLLKSSKNNVLSLLIVLFLSLAIAYGQNNFNEIKYTISGTVSHIFPYCGGAKHTEEFSKNIRGPKPYPSKKFYVINGNTNTVSHKIILSFSTDSGGNFSFKLAPGIYSLLLEEQISPPNAKKYKTKTRKVDVNCYKKWWKKPYYVFQITDSDIRDLKFEFHHRCFNPSDIPCVEYTGGFPP